MMKGDNLGRSTEKSADCFLLEISQISLRKIHLCVYCECVWRRDMADAIIVFENNHTISPILWRVPKEANKK